eukprot:gene26975-32590_t
MPSLYEILYHPQNREVTNKLVWYTVLMFSLPVLVFYATFIFIYKRDINYIYMPAIFSVITVNVVLAAYVYMAFTEDDPEAQKDGKEAKEAKEASAQAVETKKSL